LPFYSGGDKKLKEMNAHLGKVKIKNVNLIEPGKGNE